MVTLVGKQLNFTNVLKELAELDYDAVEAYKVAGDKLENPIYKSQIEKFRQDHERHIEQINKLLMAQGEESVKGPSAKQFLTKGKVYLADLMGDDVTILKAMLTNEDDTNTAYEQAIAHADKWAEASAMLEQGLQDERKHREWLKATIK